MVKDPEGEPDLAGFKNKGMCHEHADETFKRSTGHFTINEFLRYVIKDPNIWLMLDKQQGFSGEKQKGEMIMEALDVKLQLKPKEYRSAIEPTWCAGCGDFAVTAAICNAFSQLNVNPDEAIIVSGIGCSSRLPLWMRTFGFHSCHGRALPVAIGIKLARPELLVMVTIGDGDAFSIGGGHLPHAARRNIDITLVVMDNQIYALTKKQVSPTSREGMKGSTTPYGTIDSPMNTLTMMLTYGATFVAQAFAGNPKVTGDIIKQAIEHKGFSFVNILSPCPTFNTVDTFDYYRPRIYNIDETHRDKRDRMKAFEIAESALNHTINPDAKVPVGILYKVEKPVYESRVAGLKGKYHGADITDLKAIYNKFRA